MADNAPPAVFVAVDLFHAGSYGDWTGDTLRERDCFYFVLQPFLRRTPYTHQGVVYSSPTLTDYFRSWTGAELEKAGALVVLNSEWEGIGHDHELVPVPFPPGTKLSCTVKGGAATVTVSRTVGDAADPFVLTGKWAEFARRNRFSVQATEWKDLDGAQVARVLDWAYGLKAVYQAPEGPPADLSELETKEVIPLLKGAPDARRLTKVEHEAAGGNGRFDPTPFDSYMTAGSPPPAATLLELCRRPEARATRRLVPPSFQLTADQIEEKVKASGEAKIFPDATYHRWLWNRMGEAFAGADDPAEAHARLGDALQRLYGFGERLESPPPASDAGYAHLMRVPRDTADAGGWIVANVHALAGQVFRLGPFDAPASLAWSGLDVRVAGVNVVAGQEAGVATTIKAMWAEAATLGPNPFAGILDRDPVHPLGRAWFLPRNGRCADTGVRLGDGSRVLSVPGALLDAVDPSPRQESPPGRDELVVLNPQPVVLRDEHLFAPETLAARGARRLVRARVLLERVPVALREEPVYRATLVDPLNAADRAYLAGVVAGLAADASAALWVEQKPAAAGTVPVAVFGLAGLLLRSDPGGAGDSLAFVFRDRGTELTKLLPTQKTPQGEQVPQERYPVDLVCAVAAGAPFNLLALPAADTKPVTLMLRRIFEHRVTRSSERLLERYGFRLNRAAADSTIAGHALNFNKLTLRLDPRGGSARLLVLTETDAILPLPHPAGAQQVEPSEFALADETTYPFSYFVSHHFSHELREDPAQSEDGRFATVRDAGTEWTLNGKVEHQYGHRFGVAAGETLRFGLSTDALSLAAVSLKPRATVDTDGLLHAAKDEPGREKVDAVYALLFDHRPAKKAGEVETLELRLNPAYLKRLREEAKDAPARMRDLYEALLDLATAERAALRLDCFVVDNTLGPPAPAAVADPDTATELPSLAQHLRCVVSADAAFPAADPVARRWAAVVGGDFGDFRKAVETAKEGDALFDPIAIPLDRWELGGLTPRIHEWANVIRLGLEVMRPAPRTIAGALPPEASFVLMPLRTEEGKDGKKELPQEVADDPAYAALDDAEQKQAAPFVEMRQAARGELDRYLARGAVYGRVSPLHRSFGWIASEDTDYKDAAEKEKSDPLRGRRIFGEAFRVLNFPTGYSDGPDTVASLYYVLMGFRPTAAHPLVGDARTSFEFAEYLVTLLGALAAGNDAVVKDLVGLVAPADTAAAWAHRQEAREILTGTGAGKSVVRQLVELLWRVDPQAADAWGHESGGGGKTDERYLHANASFWSVVEPARATLEALLAADPSLYAWSKAIALGVFDPDSYARALYALQVTKHIREGGGKDSLPDTDTDRFTLARFFGREEKRFVVDVLDDQSYDNDFQIRRSVFPGEDPTRPPGRRSKRKIQTRGTTLARTGEDVIEQQYPFLDPASGDPRLQKPRGIDADVVHYNPEWRFGDPGTKDFRELYLLPSREPPHAPVVLVPSDPAMRRAPAEIKLSQSPVDLDGQLSKIVDGLSREVGIAPAQGGEVTQFLKPRKDAFVRDLKGSRGWWYQDSTLEHHYFQVEVDEEGDIDNDAFEIVLERARTPFPEEGLPPAVSPPLDDPLFGWFHYHRRREEAAKQPEKDTADTEALKKPAELAVPAAFEKLRKWLRPADASPSLLDPQPPAQPDGVAADGIDRFVSVFSTEKNGKGRLEPRVAPADTGGTPQNPALGGIVAVETMKVVQRAGGKEEERKKTVGLHVVVLTSCSRYCRVRVRVLRNARDRDGNRQPELNRAFLMRSAFSPWAAMQREPVERDYASAEAVSPLLSPLTPARPTFDEWLDATGATFDLGDVLQALVTRTVDTAAGGRVNLWNVGDLLVKAHVVRGTVLQRLADHHVRIGIDGAPPVDAPERSDYVARQLLGKWPADELASFFTRGNALQKNEIRTATPLLKVTWTGPAGAPMLNVTWPIVWKS